MAAFAAAAAAVILGSYFALGRLGGDSSAAASKPDTASIRATAKRGDVKLVIDGKEIGPLPQDVKGLAPGEHSVVFEGGDRYAPQKNTVTLAASETKDVELGPLRVTKGAATFDVKTPGTALALISADERRALTDYSHPIDIDNAKTWTLEASKAGFKTLTMPVNFDDKAEKTFVVALTDPGKATDVGEETRDEDALPASKGDRGAQTATAKADPASATKSAASPPQAPAALPKAPAAAAAPAPAPAPAPAKTAAGNCTLNINSIPISKVTLDGRPLGLTPKMGVSVSAGTHNVMMISDSGRKSTSATCKTGETKTIAVRITQ